MMRVSISANRRHRNIDPYTFAGNVACKKDEGKEGTREGGQATARGNSRPAEAAHPANFVSQGTNSGEEGARAGADDR